MKLDFTLVERAGLSRTEFARMCQVQRSTPRYWIIGVIEPSETVRPRVEAVLDAISNALSRGDLPMDRAIKNSVRARKLAEIIQPPPSA